MNSLLSPLDRHRRITLLFLKHSRIRNTRPGEKTARDLARDIETLGSPFIPAARLLSCRADFLPQCLIETFSALPHSLVPDDDPDAENLETVDRIMEDELGKKALRAFASFHPEPCGFSGVGQIHHAVLHDGTHARVRIQRPSARLRLVKDLDTLAEIAAFIDHPSGRGEQHRFSRFVDQIRLASMRELDYRREETILQELREKMDGSDFIQIPRPISGYCSSRVLTTEFIDGTEIWENPMPRDRSRAKQLAAGLVTAYLDQMLVHGVIHLRPHLENLLISTGGKIVLTEATGNLRLTPASRALLNHLLGGICTQDARVCADAALRIGHRTKSGNPVDRQSFLEDIQTALAVAGIPARLRLIARASSRHHHPFSPDLCRIADLIQRLSAAASAVCPGFATEALISTYLSEHKQTSRQNTLQFPSPSAA